MNYNKTVTEYIYKSQGEQIETLTTQKKARKKYISLPIL